MVVPLLKIFCVVKRKENELNSLRLSATALQDWEECKTRFLYRYIYGLRPDEEKDSQRIGTAWHGCHEIIRMVPQSKCPKCCKRGELRDDCYLCDGTGILPADLMDAVTRYINHIYAEVPDSKTADEWETERIRVLYSFIGYRWYYGDGEFDNAASEVWFDNQIVNPRSKREMTSAHIVGKVDHILQHRETGLYYIGERKSTSKSLDDASYWGRLELDVQVTTYLYELRIAQLLGKLQCYGIKPDDPLIHGIWYDVWHKPDIKPKALSQKDTAAFIETGEYCGERFEVIRNPDNEEVGEKRIMVIVNGVDSLVIPGKRGFAIHETPEMYGARLMADIAERPEHYFAQREIPRSDEQLEEFETDLYRIAQAAKSFRRNDLWTKNCRSCESPFWCDFRNICYNHIGVGPNDVPDGFKKGR